MTNPPLARETGLEPATSGVTGRRSNQLSYSRSSRDADLRRVGAFVNPLSRRKRFVVGGDGFEPPTLSV